MPESVTSCNLSASNPAPVESRREGGKKLGRRAAKAAAHDVKLAQQAAAAKPVCGRRTEEDVAGAASIARPTERFLWDDEVPGFGIRVSASGGRCYFVQYRERGRTRRRKIADVNALDVRVARRRARTIISRVQLEQGMVDPFKPPARQQALTFAAYAERFLADHTHRWAPATLSANRRFISQYLLPDFGDRDLTTITRAEVMAWRDGKMETPGIVNRVLPVLSVMMREAETLGLRPHASNPCRRLRRAERPGLARFLTADELARLGIALWAMDSQYPKQCAIVRLLLLTGARKSEIAMLQWGWIDGSYIHLPTSKNGPRIVYLGKAARAVLATVPRLEGQGLLFPDNEGKPITLQGRWWCQLLERAAITHCRIHDLRHSFASHAVMLRIGLPSLGKLLGHSLAETTQRYAHLSDEAVSDAVRRMSDRLGRATNFAAETLP